MEWLFSRKMAAALRWNRLPQKTFFIFWLFLLASSGWLVATVRDSFLLYGYCFCCSFGLLFLVFINFIIYELLAFYIRIAEAFLISCLVFSVCIFQLQIFWYFRKLFFHQISLSLCPVRYSTWQGWPARQQSGLGRELGLVLCSFMFWYVLGSTLNIVNIYSSSRLMVNDLKICHSLHGSSLILGDFNLQYSLWDPTSLLASECSIDWLFESHFCLMNASIWTHMTPNGASSLTFRFLPLIFLPAPSFAWRRIPLAVIISLLLF